MEIKVTIEATELAGAINNLAAAITQGAQVPVVQAPVVGAEPAEAVVEPVEEGKKPAKTSRRSAKKDKPGKVEDVPEEEAKEASAVEDSDVTEDTATAAADADDEDDMLGDEDKAAEEPKLTREDVQKRLKVLASEGKSAGIKKILVSCGVKKFSEVPDDKLAEILAKAEKL